MEPDDSRQQLAEAWRERLNAARQEYERARLAAGNALEHAIRDSSSEYIEALTEYHRRESLALEEYMRISRIFLAVVVYGKKSDEP